MESHTIIYDLVIRIVKQEINFDVKMDGDPPREQRSYDDGDEGVGTRIASLELAVLAGGGH